MSAVQSVAFRMVKNDPARVLVVEDEWIVGRAVEKTLETAGFEVTDVVGTASDALESIRRREPDLVLLDIALSGGMDGVQLAGEIRREIAAPCVFVSAHADGPTLERAAAMQPAGFVVKPFREAQLIGAVTIAVRRPDEPARTAEARPEAAPPAPPTAPVDVRRQQLQQVAAAVARQAPNRPQGGNLTERELEVVRLLLSNGRVSSIAQQLDISPHTVRNHLRAIFRKLGVHSQVELIRELTDHSVSTSSAGAA